MGIINLRDYQGGRCKTHGPIKGMLWYIINAVVFDNYIPFPSGFKRKLLRVFGAVVGVGVVIKPKVNIKYPWLLEVGDYTWLGENVWIDNLCSVKIQDNVCVSQGAMLLTGNHNYKSTGFDLFVEEIIIEHGVWIGAKAVVCPGVTCHRLSVLSVNSVAVSDLECNTIYQGNPAIVKRTRMVGLD